MMLRLKIRDRRAAAAVLVLAVLSVGFALTSTFASATPAVDPGELPAEGNAETETSAFTGPTMSSASAVQVAIGIATGAGDANPTGMSQMAGTFAETQAVMSQGKGGSMRESAETAAWFKSATYLTVMHGHFTGQLVAPGTNAVEGTVLAVITDAHNGWIEGESIGDTAPSSTSLSAVTAPAVADGPALEAGGGRARIAASAVGVLAGRLTRAGWPVGAPRLPLPDWQVVVGKDGLPQHIIAGLHSPNVVATARSDGNGAFILHLRPGRYLVAGVETGGASAHAKVCAPKHVTIAAGRRTAIEIGC
jgi:hypothetical protein